jgi:hypothetical protein
MPGRVARRADAGVAANVRLTASNAVVLLVLLAAETGSRVEVWINQAGDVVVPPMEQAEIAHRVELAQGLAAAGFAAGLGTIGWLTRQSLGRRRQAA